jgi:hypothetical protein
VHLPRRPSILPSVAIPTLIASLLFSGSLAPAAARPHTRPDGPHLPSSPQVVDDIQRIDINDISMVVKNTGSIAYDTQNGAAGLEFPKGSGHTAVFAAGLWLGAVVGGQVRVTVSEYSDEYQPGSMVGGAPDSPLNPEYKVYKLFRSYPTAADRDAALADYNAGAVPHGAPPVAVLGDGTLGIRGDQMLWCVFNDAAASPHHNQAGGTPPLGVEVQLTAFAYSPPAAGPANRTVFLHYKFLNKGLNALEQLRIGMWVDPDLGGATDDLVGSDPARGMGYVYNSPNVDEQYGSTPPAVGFDLLHGPLGPGGPLAANAFTMYTNGGDLQSAIESYNVLQGLSRTGAPVIDPTTGLPTPFQVPGDPIAGTGWIDTAPADKRMILGTGAVDLLPGQVQEVDYAIVIGQGINRLSSVATMRCNDDAIQAFFDRSFAPPLPAVTECNPVVNCPRPANYWYQQFSSGGVFSPAQLAEIAGRVDAATLYLDWSADPVTNLRNALNPASAVDPLSQAIREFAAFQCNLAVSAPPVIPSGVPPVFLELATPVSCPGLAASSIHELAETAVVGLSDADYLDVGPNPTALTGVTNVGLPFWGGAAGYAADLFGSSIPSGTHAHTVEIRFTGGAPGQYAYRYLRTLDGVGNRVYLIQDYVPVPWTVWDIDTNTQLNGAFLENAGPPPATNMDGQWNPDESSTGGRELVWAMDSPYSGDATPDSKYFTDPDLQDMLAGQVDLRYVMYPRLTAAGAVIDDGDRFRWTWGGIIPSLGVDAMLFHLAALPPGDPSQLQGYSDISGCLSSINSGFGIGPTCDVPTPVLVSLVGAEAAPDHVTIQWFIGGSAASSIRVERREAGAGWTGLRDVQPDGSGMVEFRDTDIVAGQAYDYRLGLLDGGQFRWLGQVSVTVPLENVLALEGFHPNPAGRDIQLAFTLASREPARLTVFDLAGRRLLSRDVGALGAGRHVVPLDRGTSLPSGIYLLQLTQGNRTITRRATAIR